MANLSKQPIKRRVALLEAAFEAQLTYRPPLDLAAVMELLETLAREVTARGAVRVFIQQWPADRIAARWQDFRVATVKLFRTLRLAAEMARNGVSFDAPGHAIVMAA